ncbi:anti-sigma factor family protein [Paenibacillus sp. GCM10023250]|uniref:anti-sigma factor family protein n=1 Tax=Paenibacillus sp. GCM10023250 TaxID=3252648 RepID=UPI0036223925
MEIDPNVMRERTSVMKRHIRQKPDTTLCDFAASYMFGGLDEAMRSAFEGHLANCGECRRFVADIAFVTNDCPKAGSAESAPPAGLKAWVRAFLLRHDLTEKEHAYLPRIIGSIIAACRRYLKWIRRASDRAGR